MKKKAKSDKVVVSAETDAHVQESSRRWALLAAVVVVVAAAVVIGVVVWRNHHKAPNVQSQTKNPTLNSLYAGNLALDDPATHDKLARALTLASNKTDKIALLHALGENDLQLKQYKAALDYFLQAKNLGDSSSSNYISIAMIYEENLNDTSNALKYYKLALKSAKQEQAKATDPMAKDQVDFVQGKVDGLEQHGAH